MVTSRKKLDFWFWVKVVVIGFMLIFLIYPFCTLITRSFFSNKTAGFTFENYIRFFTKKYYYSALGRSLFVSIVTTCTTLLVGVPIAYLMSRYNVFGKNFISHFYHHESYEPAVHRCLQLDHAVWPRGFCDKAVCKYRHSSAEYLWQAGYHPGIYV